MSRVVNRAAFFSLFLMVGGVLAQETAQVPLPAITLSVGGRAVTAEVADEPQERVTGLMFRKNLRPRQRNAFCHAGARTTPLSG